ncbi:hypothetical protein B0H13DRAFT_2501698 [Mycena leptocephala]|nr:hypothetical protein B0H13DRAFT_2501698 [Mycena leptocephala]
MHPALRLANLSTLPASLRVNSSLLVHAIADGIFQRIANRILNRASNPYALAFTASPATVVPLLPVWYLCLDPAGIPTSDVIEAAQDVGRRMDVVVTAAFSLRMIPMLRNAPSGVYPILWARFWPWVSFLHTYGYYLVDLPKREDLYATFAMILVHFQAVQYPDPISSTQGVRVVVGAAWDVLLDAGDPDAIRNISFLLNWDFDKAPPGLGCLQEYLEGTGGGIEHLASMLVKHLSHAIVDGGKKPMSKAGVSNFTAAMAFILRIRDVQEFSESFRAAANRRAIVPALIAGICSLNSVAGEYSNGLYLLIFALNLVGNYTAATPGRIRICEALEAGILRAILLVGCTPRDFGQLDDPQHDNGELDQQLRFALTNSLPPYMVYRSILLDMPGFLVDVEELADTEAFKTCAIYAPWQRLHALVQDRLAFLETFDSAPSVLYKAAIIWSAARYTSSPIFAAVPHVSIYIIARKSARRLIGELGIETIAKSSRRSSAVCTIELSCVPCSTATTSFIVVNLCATNFPMGAKSHAAMLCAFDYMKGPVSVDVRPWPRDSSEMLDHPDEWFHRHYNHGYRAANGKWLLEVHLMAIPNGLKTHWKIMPMRHTDPEIVNGLWSIVGKVSGIPTTDPTFDSTVAAELEPLLVLNPQVIHE